MFINKFTSVLGSAFKWDRKTLKIILYAAAIICVAAFCGIVALLVPISPCNDSFTLVNSLKYLQNKTGFTDWSATYFNFWGNNKLALLIYFMFTRTFSMLKTPLAVEYGIRLLHFITLLAFVFSMAFAFRKLFGKQFFIFTMLLSALLYPYVILTAPYVYPLSISVAAVCFCAGVYRYIAAKIIFYISFGVLFMLRPTAAVFIVIYHLAAFIRLFISKDVHAKRYLFLIVIMILSVPVTKQAMGLVLYESGLHPYPGFANTSSLWTIYVGTNLDGAATGLIRYNVDKEPDPGDQLAVSFHRLWELASQNAPHNYAEFQMLQKQARTLLLQRAKETVLDNPAHLWTFLSYKAKNLFGHESMFAFYQLNITNERFTENAAANIQDDGWNYINFIGGLLGIALILLLCLCKNQTKALWIVIPAVIGALGTVVIFILLTEVANRYLFDILPALYVVIISTLVMLVNFLKQLGQPIVKFCSETVILLAITTAVLITYKANDIEFWRGAESQLTIAGSEAVFSISFLKDPPSGYRIRYKDMDIPLTKRTQIVFDSGSALYFYNSQSGQYVATHDPINHERFIK